MKCFEHSSWWAVLLLLWFSGAAEALECIAKAGATNARAEGEAEVVGDITLRCRGRRIPGANDPLTLGSTDPTHLDITVVLNTDVTNARTEDDMIEDVDALGYRVGSVKLTANALNANQTVGSAIPDTHFVDGAVSDDLRTVTWKVDSDTTTDGIQGLNDFQLGNPDDPSVSRDGFQLIIEGLRADASAVGHGGQITAEVKVNGTTVGSGPMVVASVTNGLAVSVKAAKGDECADVDTNATITITNAMMSMDSFLVTFKNIPEGVTVMVPEVVSLTAIDSTTKLILVEGKPGDGVGKPEGGKAMVELSATGTGEVRYTIGELPSDDPSSALTTVSDSLNAEGWANLPVYFSWSGGDVVMNADAMVYVSFYPSGDSMIPRFVGDSEADALLMIEDCVTELTFPFVSSASGYNTGIVVSNTKDAQGSCTASYAGSAVTKTSPMIDGNEHWIFLVSSHMQDYTGRLMVKCDFGGIDGYAQITDAMGNANGYLPRMQ